MTCELAATTNRRDLLATGAGLAALVAWRPIAAAAAIRTESTAEAIRRFAGDAAIGSGPIHLDLPALVENGNAVTITVAVDSPMTPEEHIRRIAVFNDKNPQPNVVTLHLGPRSGRAAVTTRIRLADTQRITAIAETHDGRYWSTSAEAIVTLAACLEG